MLMDANSCVFISSSMPKPLEDLAAAIRTIQALRGKESTYYVAGFSAGGHLAALWGTAATGAPRYDLPLPAGLLLGYPLISLNHIPEPMGGYFRKGLFGSKESPELVRLYDAAGQMTPEYPPFYLARAANDSTVSLQDGDEMANAAWHCKVRYKVETGLTGGHGFGPGTGTPLEGWLTRGILFLDPAADHRTK